ncbi:MAG: hypothetical protein HY059_09895 [Proteobacteria bacterium]|nr:hypothetical protein [Pseudomonadota bacterium]
MLMRFRAGLRRICERMPVVRRLITRRSALGTVVRGQATTEVVLLLPLFMFFLFAFAKIFALLVLVQKMEIASFYAARRWQLESHRNVSYEGFDQNALRTNILKYVNGYLGFGTPTAGFLGLDGRSAQLDVVRTQVWQIVTLTVYTKPIKLPLLSSEKLGTTKSRGFKFEVTKYVPNRDRPIAFVLPGLQP